MTTEASNDDFYGRVERRISWLTPSVGLIAAVIVWRMISSRAGAGVAIGALLIWLHYFWLRRATSAIVRAAIKPSDVPRSDSALLIFLLFVGYALLALFAYVIVVYFNLPVSSVLGGLLALGAAAMAGSAYTVIFENH